MKKLMVLIIILTSLPLCWADNNNDDMVTENINKVKTCLKNNDLAKAKAILAGDFDKYVKALYSLKFNKETMIGFPNLEYICLYSGLISFIEDDCRKGHEYVGAAVGLISVGWGESWYYNLDIFIEDNEQIFSKKSNLMKAKLYDMVSIAYFESGIRAISIRSPASKTALRPIILRLVDFV